MAVRSLHEKPCPAGLRSRVKNRAHGTAALAGRGPMWAEFLFCLGFSLVFLAVEAASKTAQGWPGAPAFYLPLGMVAALFLWEGLGYWPLSSGGRGYRGRGQLPPADCVLVRAAGSCRYLRVLHFWYRADAQMVAHRSSTGDGARHRTFRRDLSCGGGSDRGGRHDDPARGRDHRASGYSEDGHQLVGE